LFCSIAALVTMMLLFASSQIAEALVLLGSV
jgi:hypothetical protein